MGFILHQIFVKLKYCKLIVLSSLKLLSFCAKIIKAKHEQEFNTTVHGGILSGNFSVMLKACKANFHKVKSLIRCSAEVQVAGPHWG